MCVYLKPINLIIIQLVIVFVVKLVIRCVQGDNLITTMRVCHNSIIIICITNVMSVLFPMSPLDIIRTIVLLGYL